MIDVINGTIIISNTLKFYPGLQFDEFKKTEYYNGEDGIRVIYLKDKPIIDGKLYIVSFFFRNDRIYAVSLINCDKEIPEAEEFKRKLKHDNILNKNNIISGQQYEWGRVVSEFDARSNISSINIYYK